MVDLFRYRKWLGALQNPEVEYENNRKHLSDNGESCRWLLKTKQYQAFTDPQEGKHIWVHGPLHPLLTRRKICDWGVFLSLNHPTPPYRPSFSPGMSNSLRKNLVFEKWSRVMDLDAEWRHTDGSYHCTRQIVKSWDTRRVTLATVTLTHRNPNPRSGRFSAPFYRTQQQLCQLRVPPSPDTLGAGICCCVR